MGQQKQRPERIRASDRLVADLAAHAVTGDQVAARRTLGKLLERAAAEPQLSRPLAARLARVVADYDASPKQVAMPRRSRVMEAPIAAAAANVVSVSRPSRPPLALPADVMARLERLVVEWRRGDDLAAVGLQPAAKILLVGPPGVGKTITAAWLAARLELPLARVESSLIMSSLLGESARNLRAALDWGKNEPCVLLIDEFDAFAKRRDDETDIGELKRLVNMLLLELEQWPARSLLVAATNHPELLDRAIRRRFDVVLTLDEPLLDARAAIVQAFAERHRQEVPDGVVRLVASLTDGWSGADVHTLLAEALREAVVTDGLWVNGLLDRLRPPMGKDRRQTSERALFVAVAHDVGGMSNRRIAALLDLSSASVSSLARAGRALRDGV